MKYHPHQIYHIFNQGNNKQKIFFEADNYLFFLRKLRKYILPYADVLAYCLMPNHFHLLVITNEQASRPSKNIKPKKIYKDPTPIEDIEEQHFQENLSHAIGTMLSAYTKAINKRFDRSGSLFRRRTKVKNGFIDGAITVDGPNRHLFFRHDNDYAKRCFYYIHQNPVKAKLVDNEVEWIYSSARDYAGLRDGTLCNQGLAKTLLDLP